MRAWFDNGSSKPVMGRLNYLGILALIFLAGAMVRLYRIGDQVLIDDEWHALNAVQHHDFKWILTHFGISDHSIPLALFYEIEHQLTGLSEILMRWPMILVGCISLLLLPYLLRHWLNKSEQLIFTALLAISPVLIYYSRFARPYILLAVLEVIALLVAWHWWKTQKLSYGVAWVFLMAFSTWLNVPALVLVTAPFAIFAVMALSKVVRNHEWTDLIRLSAIGIATVTMLATLLGPPLATEPWAIFGKSGQHHMDSGTLAWAISLASGSGRVWVYTSMGIFALLGVRVLVERDREFAGYMVAAAALAILLLLLSGAAWAMHGNVFLRYLIGLLPLYLACAALGLAYAARWIVTHSRTPEVTNGVILAVVVLGLVALGPIPDWPIRANQFLTHQNYHFHYQPERNLYVQQMADWYKPEAFYEEISALHKPGEALIVVAPWNLASYANPLNLQQEVHRQRVQIGFINGVCSGPFFGEITIGQPGMNFRNFVYLRDILDGSQTADYLVLTRQFMSNWADKIDMDFDRCEQAARAKFGAPWRETEFSLVFRIVPGK
ncbi:MAG: glycosyltransferase family 39 protein [Xanthomonadales bacterium]|nr:glycosyltransferase family 39 protein [Xanthomonadales bacterium]